MNFAAARKGVVDEESYVTCRTADRLAPAKEQLVECTCITAEINQ